jgi:hypothetical protein
MADKDGFPLAPIKKEGGTVAKDPFYVEEEEPETGLFMGDGYAVIIKGYDTIKLGKWGGEFYAHGGIIGIDPNGCVFEGYDGSVDTDGMTPKQRRELALYMIDKWKEFGGIDGG